MKHLYFDIETVRGSVDVKASDIKAPSNYTDAVKIKAYQKKKLKELHDKAGLNSFTAKICCIAWAIDDEPVQYAVGINEEELINKLVKGIIPYDNNGFTWIGHNILSFDIPFLYHRAIKHGEQYLKLMLPKKSNGADTFDTMKKISPTDYKAMISLDKACKYFGIETPKGDLDGSKVQSYYDAGRFDEIGAYCAKDVEAVRELHKLLR